MIFDKTAEKYKETSSYMDSNDCGHSRNDCRVYSEKLIWNDSIILNGTMILIVIQNMLVI